MFTYGTMNLLLKKRQKKICMNGIRGVLRNYWSWFAYFSKGKNLEEKLLHPMMGICRDFIYHLGVISGGLIS
jgi:hypothetical protein